MQEPVAQRAWFGSGEVPVEADALAPREQVAGGEHQLHPSGVGVKGAEGHALEPAVLELADAVLHLGVAAVAQLQVDGVTLAVGEHDLVARPVVVPQAQLGAGVGLLPPTDRPGPRRPSLQGDVELDNLGTSAVLAVGVSESSMAKLYEIDNDGTNDKEVGTKTKELLAS